MLIAVGLISVTAIGSSLLNEAIKAAVGRTGMRPMVLSAFGFGVVLLLAAIAPTLPLELIALAAVGFASVTFLAMGNSTLQLATEPQMRGRVMALWSVAFLGSTIGNLVPSKRAEFLAELGWRRQSYVLSSKFFWGIERGGSPALTQPRSRWRTRSGRGR